MEQNRMAIFQRGLRGECPRCRSGDLFQSKYRFRESCPQCQLPLEQEDGWALGAIPLNYSLTCLGWVLPWGLLFLFGLVSLKTAGIAAILGTFTIPFLTYRYSKKVWLGLYYAILPKELRQREPGEKGDIH